MGGVAGLAGANNQVKWMRTTVAANVVVIIVVRQDDVCQINTASVGNKIIVGHGSGSLDRSGRRGFGNLHRRYANDFIVVKGTNHVGLVRICRIPGKGYFHATRNRGDTRTRAVHAGEDKPQSAWILLGNRYNTGRVGFNMYENLGRFAILQHEGIGRIHRRVAGNHWRSGRTPVKGKVGGGFGRVDILEDRDAPQEFGFQIVIVAGCLRLADIGGRWTTKRTDRTVQLGARVPGNNRREMNFAVFVRDTIEGDRVDGGQGNQDTGGDVATGIRAREGFKVCYHTSHTNRISRKRADCRSIVVRGFLGIFSAVGNPDSWIIAIGISAV